MPVASSRSPQLRMDYPCPSPELETIHDNAKNGLVSKATNDRKNDFDASIVSPSRRAVTWNEEVYVQETKHINDMDDDEVDDIWYSRRDYELFKMGYLVTVKMMSTARGIPKECPDHCARGLEYRTRDGSRRRQLNKLNALSAVLDEQERQRIQGLEDDKALAQVYKSFNKHCRESALAAGLSDAESAEYGDLSDLYGPITDENPASTTTSPKSLAPPDLREHAKKPTPFHRLFRAGPGNNRRQEVLDDIKAVSSRRSASSSSR